MARMFLSLLLLLALCAPASAQVMGTPNTAGKAFKPNTFQYNNNGGYTYRGNGYSSSTDAHGNTTHTGGGWTTHPNGKTTYNGPTYGYPKR